MPFAFSDCLLDTATLTLTRSGAPVPVEPQVFDLIRLLVENASRVVTRDEIVAVVWGGRIVSESAISARIAAARKAVGDDGQRQAIIRTVARRGLQMVAEVTSDTAQPAQARPTPTAQNIRFARAPDGAALAYAVTGTGPPLLLSWHFPTNLERDWTNPDCRAFFDAVGRDRSLLRYDHRGSGQSEPMLDRVDPARAADDLLAVVDAAGFDSVDVLGMSSGALFATHLAAGHPERVKRLVLMGGYVHGRARRGSEPADENAETILSLIRAGWDTPGSPFLNAWVTAYYPDASPTTVRAWAHNIRAACTIDALLAMRQMTNTADIAEALPRVRVPTLVIHSREDAVHPLAEGRKLAQGIPDASLTVIDGANHNPFPGMTGWDGFLHALDGFLD